MTETQATIQPKTEASKTAAPSASTPRTGTSRTAPRTGGSRPGQSGGRGGRPTRRPERVKPEFEQKILTIRRVTRVMKGGRRFSFSVTIAIGNRQGVVGVGVGKAGDTSLAIQKAYNNAKRNLVRLRLSENKSIGHDVQAKYSSAIVKLMPNTARGLVAGSGVRAVLELAGVTDITAKILTRSKNQLNVARATIDALAPFSEPYVEKSTKKADAKDKDAKAEPAKK